MMLLNEANGLLTAQSTSGIAVTAQGWVEHFAKPIMLHRREDRGGFRFVVPGEIDDTSDAGANGPLCELRDDGILHVICPTRQMVS
jgi:hypothetical protein